MAWIIDPAHSHIGFSVRHMMVTTVRGQFTAFRGRLVLDPANPAHSQAEVEIDVDSVNTQNADRDNHLRTSDFFDLANHPQIRYRSTQITQKGDDEFEVTGELTIRGVTQSVTLQAEYAGVTKNTFGKEIVGISARGKIRRQDFGLSWNALLEAGGLAVSEQVKLELELQAYREE